MSGPQEHTDTSGAGAGSRKPDEDPSGAHSGRTDDADGQDGAAMIMLMLLATGAARAKAARR